MTHLDDAGIVDTQPRQTRIVTKVKRNFNVLRNRYSNQVAYDADPYYGDDTHYEDYDFTNDVMKLFAKELEAATQQGKQEGAEEMWDMVVLFGVEIDGVDYLKLDDVEERARVYLNSLNHADSGKGL